MQLSCEMRKINIFVFMSAGKKNVCKRLLNTDWSDEYYHCYLWHRAASCLTYASEKLCLWKARDKRMSHENYFHSGLIFCIFFHWLKTIKE